VKQLSEKEGGQEGANRSMSLAEQAYEQLKEKILKNDYPSGEFISINFICESLDGLGRTPVREAVQKLHEERLLSVVPRKGIIVPEFDIRSMLEQLELRFVLERYATVQAAGKLSQTDIKRLENMIEELRNHDGKSAYTLARVNMFFHMFFAEMTKNKELISTLNHIYDHQIRVYTFYYEDSDRPWSTQLEHTAILKALVSGDLAAIETAMLSHYENTRQALLHSLLD
jgi:DNA-binding GntR family transcriptional regulator